MNFDDMLAIAHEGVVPHGPLPSPTHPTHPRPRNGFGWCLRCGRSNEEHRYHETAYGEGSGCFPLCEPCWAALSPEDRLPWYHRLLNCWGADEGLHVQVELAVLAGG